MKAAEFYYFTLPPDAWNKKPRRSRWMMSIEDADKRHPGAVPDLQSKEVRNIAETPEEAAEFATSLHDRIVNRWPGG